MEKDDEILEMQMDDEELLNFDLGDLSPEDMEQEPAEGDADDEIIELMDLVEKGEAAGAGDVAELPEEDR
ncbi:MAG: hypothetical protein JRJ06_01105, partial [Deltaproteobacteria bacterium]|nr:hypothetical protein [Deltaproteobacteria bacterium]